MIRPSDISTKLRISFWYSWFCLFNSSFSDCKEAKSSDFLSWPALAYATSCFFASSSSMDTSFNSFCASAPLAARSFNHATSEIFLFRFSCSSRLLSLSCSSNRFLDCELELSHTTQAGTFSHCWSIFPLVFHSFL